MLGLALRIGAVEGLGVPLLTDLSLASAYRTDGGDIPHSTAGQVPGDLRDAFFISGAARLERLSRGNEERESEQSDGCRRR